MTTFLLHGIAAFLWTLALLFAAIAGHILGGKTENPSAIPLSASVAAVLSAIAFTLQVIA